MELTGIVPPQAVIECELLCDFPGILHENCPLLRPHTSIVRRCLVRGVIVTQKPAGKAEPGGKSAQGVGRSEWRGGRVGSGRQRNTRIVCDGISLNVDLSSNFVTVLPVSPRHVGVKRGLVVMVDTLDLTEGAHVLHASVKRTRH